MSRASVWNGRQGCNTLISMNQRRSVAMTPMSWKSAFIAMLLAGIPTVLHAQATAPDFVLTNGKIITVDDRFSIAQAVAIKGDRIVAVGSNEDIARLAGPNTRRMDLGGRSVVPGF